MSYERSACFVLRLISSDHNNYNLRPRRHELVLAIKRDARNFFEKQLFKDTYISQLTVICDAISILYFA